MCLDVIILNLVPCDRSSLIFSIACARLKSSCGYAWLIITIHSDFFYFICNCRIPIWLLNLCLQAALLRQQGHLHRHHRLQMVRHDNATQVCCILCYRRRLIIKVRSWLRHFVAVLVKSMFIFFLGSTSRAPGTSSATASTPTSLRLDQQTISFSVNAWVLNWFIAYTYEHAVVMLYIYKITLDTTPYC